MALEWALNKRMTAREMFDLGGGTTTMMMMMMMMMTAVMIWKGKKWRKWRRNQKENKALQRYARRDACMTFPNGRRAKSLAISLGRRNLSEECCSVGSRDTKISRTSSELATNYCTPRERVRE